MKYRVKGEMPMFIDSPYFVMEEDNWHLKEGAPKEVRDEFEEFMKEYEELDKHGIIK